MINLIHPDSAIRRNGTVTFTGHLCVGLLNAGLPFRLIRIGKEGAKPKTGKFAGFNVEYETLEPTEVLRVIKKGPSLLLSNEHEKNMTPPGFMATMIRAGARVMIHGSHECDPKSKRSYPFLWEQELDRPIIIRKPMKAFYKDAVFLPHPYARAFRGWQGSDLFRTRPDMACSISRVYGDKRPGILLDANRLLRKPLHIAIHGEENRLFTYGLMRKYPEFKQGTPRFPPGTGTDITRRYNFLVDMTKIHGDGGGSQYTFMEGWDAGSVLVVHRDWLAFPGEMQEDVNCVAVESGAELAALLAQASESKALQKKLTKIALEGTTHLEKDHDPITIARRYYRELTR